MSVYIYHRGYVHKGKFRLDNFTHLLNILIAVWYLFTVKTDQVNIDNLFVLSN